MDSDVPETTTDSPVHFCMNLDGTDTNFIKGCVIYPQASLIHQCNHLLQKSHLRKNWRLETETSTHCSKNSNSLCSTILKTTWHYVCVHSTCTAAVKMKQLLHLDVAYRKILCFKKHKDSISCVIQMAAQKLYEIVQVLGWGNSAVLQKR